MKSFTEYLDASSDSEALDEGRLNIPALIAERRIRKLLTKLSSQDTDQKLESVGKMIYILSQSFLYELNK